MILVKSAPKCLAFIVVWIRKKKPNLDIIIPWFIWFVFLKHTLNLRGQNLTHSSNSHINFLRLIWFSQLINTFKCKTQEEKYCLVVSPSWSSWLTWKHNCQSLIRWPQISCECITSACCLHSTTAMMWWQRTSSGCQCLL